MNLLTRLTGASKAGEIFSDIKRTLVSKRAPWLSYGGAGHRHRYLSFCLSSNLSGSMSSCIMRPASSVIWAVHTDSSLLQTIIVGAVNLVFTVLAIFTVDKFGRKPLQIIGALGMAASMICLGFILLQQSGNGGPDLHAGVYRIFCDVMGPGDLGPSFGDLSQFHQGSHVDRRCRPVDRQSDHFLDLSDPRRQSMAHRNFHKGFAYWIYGVMGILAAIFVWKFVPETKGKTLEDMENIWKKG